MYEIYRHYEIYDIYKPRGIFAERTTSQFFSFLQNVTALALFAASICNPTGLAALVLLAASGALLAFDLASDLDIEQDRKFIGEQYIKVGTDMKITYQRRLIE